ncbi:DUF659 domain-containing protein [Mycena sanguinolenta]|uniref:DUF659 domain-containing protein n=1 Tax=Mycena sanguinolenta TaxID=230812 RepID=A0A8H7D9V1_9AGAR|nr:DUF659 domain-containing protein [Mycena sanguinolenta]
MADKKKETQPAAGDNTIIDVDATGALTEPISRKERKALQASLDGYVDQAMTTAQKNSADRKLLRFLIHANIPFQSAENPYLDEFLHYLSAEVFLRESDHFQKSKLLTLLEDGLEDKLKRSIYAIVAAGIDSFPIVMGLEDLTGERGNADKCLDISVSSLELMGVEEPRNLIALTTDNPTTMQSFRWKFQNKFFWILTFIITKANRSVTFFNGSHYWGGQLKDEAQRFKITLGLKNAIGNSESRQTTLADCMLELIRCTRSMSKMELEENEDGEFLTHAKQTVDRRFQMIATPIHWLALFLHPLCRKLAVSPTVYGRSLDFMIETALGVAIQWKWDMLKAMRLKTDLKAYHQFKSPFTGGHRDAREWWGDVPKENHEGIRELSIVLANIVPHSAEVGRLFSGLGGIQTPRRSTLTVSHMEKMGKIRSRLSYELYIAAKQKTGATEHRKHSHMHTQSTPGINADLAQDLENPITWIPPLDRDDEETEDIVEKAYQDLQKTLNDEGPCTAQVGSVIDGEVVDWDELERVERGEPTVLDGDTIDFIGNGPAPGWTVEDLMLM